MKPLPSSTPRRAGLARRELLALGALGAAASLVRPARSEAGGGHRALVCVFLYGGADTLNLVVPTAPDAYGAYAAARGDLAEPLESLLPVEPVTPAVGPLGLHARAGALRDLFAERRLSFVSNVGPLVRPLTKAEYEAGGAVPGQLFSHNDQQHEVQRAWSQGSTPFGWAGRALAALGTSPNALLPPAIAVHKSDLLLRGASTTNYVVGVNGSTSLTALDDPARAQLLFDLFDRAEHPLSRAAAGTQLEAIEIDSVLSGLLPQAPTFAGLFPPHFLGAQLRMVARLIALREPLGAERQVYLVGQGGWDTHDDQPARLEQLIAELSESLGAFQTAIDSIGAGPEVVTFTQTEFGRTLSTNGKGSDHGWGTHALVMGDPVLGGDLYGALPDFTLGGPDDVGSGRLLPAIGVDPYAATLARWLGVGDTELPSVFPNLPNFPEPHLGFLS